MKQSLRSRKKPSQDLTKSRDIDFFIVGDGSSFHLDNIGGYGAVILGFKPHTKKYNVIGGAATHTDVNRAELLAILNSLHAILVDHKWDKPERVHYMSCKKCAVHVMSDSLWTVNGILNVKSRKSNGDLWAMFAWYEDIFSITASHINRDTDPLQKKADFIASAMRVVLKEFYDEQLMCENL